jgi:hypothetical protein
MSRLTAYFQGIEAFSTPQTPAYPWDEWAYTDYFYHETPEMLAIFKPLTGLACRATCIAIGEWIAARRDRAANIALARDYFDAAWVTVAGHTDPGRSDATADGAPGAVAVAGGFSGLPSPFEVCHA